MSQCAICSDLFDGVERVMAAPCGHVFHSKCLLKWLNVGKTCPECRKTVLRQNCIELYFNINTSGTVNPISLCNEVENLRALVHERTKETNDILDKNKELRNMIVVLEATVESLRQANMRVEDQLSKYSSELPDLRTTVRNLKEKNSYLGSELEFLQDIKTIVTGTQKDAEEILQEAVSNASEKSHFIVAQRLAFCCSLTKRELKRAIDEKNELRKEIIEINKNRGLCLSKLKTSKCTVKRLERRIEELENAASRSFSECRASTSEEPSTSDHAPHHKQSPKKSFEMTPITAEFGRKEKHKMSVVVLDKEREKMSVPCHSSVSTMQFSPIAMRRKETDSVSSVGYNGLGGHHSIIIRSDHLPAVGRSMKYSLVPTKKKFRKL